MDGRQLCQLGPSEDHDSDAFVSQHNRNIILWRYGTVTDCLCETDAGETTLICSSRRWWIL